MHFFFLFAMDPTNFDEDLFGGDDEVDAPEGEHDLSVAEREESDDDGSVDHDPFDEEEEDIDEINDDISVAEDEQIETFVNMNEDEMLDHTNFIIAHEHLAALKFTIGQQAAFRLACMKIKDANRRLNEVFHMMKSMKVNEIYTM